jgi:hypothetical protein
MPCQGLQNYVLTDHVRWQMQRRSISEAELIAVLEAPEQCEEVRPGRCVYQSMVSIGESSRPYLLRVFVDVDRDPPEVVTAYRTSRVEKYWR